MKSAATVTRLSGSLLASAIAFVFQVLPLTAATVSSMTGETYEGSVTLDSGLLITPKAGPASKMDFSNVLRARLADEPAGNSSQLQPGVVMRNGTRLAIAAPSLDESTIKIPKYALSVPTQDVAWIIYQPISDSFSERLTPGTTGVVLPGGDFFEGTIKSADSRVVKVLSPIFGVRSFNIALKEAVAVVLHDVKPIAAAYAVATTDGFLFSGDGISADRASLSVRSAALGLLRIDGKEVAEIRAGSARYQSLTTLKPSRIDAPAGQSGTPAFSVDKSLDGHKLAASGAEASHGFESGIGVVATWELPPGFNVFVAQAALSPSTQGENTRVAFAVYADGKAVFRSPPYGASEGIKTVRATIAGAHMLSLRVEPSSATSTVGSGIWIEPLLIKR